MVYCEELCRRNRGRAVCDEVIENDWRQTDVENEGSFRRQCDILGSSVARSSSSSPLDGL